MFGRPIYDHCVGDEAAVRRLAEQKRRVIAGYHPAAAYIETSHALLKSWADVAAEFFPRMKLIHLVRNPLCVAKSETVRENLIRRWRIPFRNYRGGDGQRYFRWALTGLEPIFASFKGMGFSRFQWYVIQWIEIENRAMQFLQKHKKHADCCTLHSPSELNEPGKMRSLLEFLDLPRSGEEMILKGRKNRTPGMRMEVTESDQQEFAEVVGVLPVSCLEIFQQPPYCQWEWAKILSPKPKPIPPIP